MNIPNNKLIWLAAHKMKHCHDPIHDYNHVKRVVNYSETIAKSQKLTTSGKQTLLLAAWWHDVGRTVTSKSSLFFMSMFDDIISAIMLFYFAFRNKQLNKVTINAVIILLSKSLLLKWFSHFLLSKQEKKIILQILEDADSLDMLNISRTEQIRKIVNKSPTYASGYKHAINWLLTINKIKMQTIEAKNILIELLQNFIDWILQPEIFEWHEKLFEKKWLNKKIISAKKILNKNILEIELS